MGARAVDALLLVVLPRPRCGEENTYSLVFPTEADFSQGKISVLAPIGTAILGYRSGDTIEWTVPSYGDMDHSSHYRTSFLCVYSAA